MSYVAEEWRPVAGWPYEVSSLGRVRRTMPPQRPNGGGNTHPGRLLASTLDTGGYPRLQLSDGKRSWPVAVHMLVALAFLEGPPGEIGKRSHQFQINHIDGDKRNNFPENLEWVTHRENCVHAIRSGLNRNQARGSRQGNSRLTEAQVAAIRAAHAAGSTGRSLAAAYGVAPTNISNIVRRISWRHVP